MSATRPLPEPSSELLLERSLEALAGREGALAECAFGHLFAGHPEIEALFGAEAISEREEMVRETLASVLAMLDDEPWWVDNLEAMGASHHEYGVRDEMYDRWIASLVVAMGEVIPEAWSARLAAAWRDALEAICEPMRRAGRRKALAAR